MAEDLKHKTAATLKWNTIDRLASQVLYAVVGIVLANLISQEDFGLAGALLVFQAFANLFVDSGFGAAIIQKKNPTEQDYSTVFWFNLGTACVIYLILFLCAPLIADIFQSDTRLISLSKVMFLTFIFTAVGLVQTVKMMKQMDVKQIAIANVVAQCTGGALGIYLAVTGRGPWALVWQSVTQAAVKSAWLWAKGHWWPGSPFSIDSLRQMWRLALSVFSSSALNTFFLYIYSFVIGAFYNLVSLGVYTQADKWSKMGSASISQVMTASFVPVLSKYQDDPDHYRQCMRRINRFCAMIVFPALLGLAVTGTPLFHALFGDKWDAAIILFQILSVRGVFVVLISLMSNYMLALGYGKRIFKLEIIKDVSTIVALLATVWSGSLMWLVTGQLAASVLTWAVTLGIVSRASGYRVWGFLRDLLPFAAATLVGCLLAGTILLTDLNPWIQLIAILAIGLLSYMCILAVARVPELKEALSSLRQRPVR